MRESKPKILSVRSRKYSLSRLMRSLLILIFFSASIYAQSSDFKSSAKIQMKEGKFSEAIELLNNQIASVPRDAEGYALRAECYVHTGQHYDAVLDWEKAVALEPSNRNYVVKLSETKHMRNSILLEKIKGHQREIAIDPSLAENYLAIGKAYMKMEDSKKAEEYYDEYLSRVPETSPDEILRYTEILAKNNETKKGEDILKEYADKYPDDWRLQSRYGYFLMWRGKYRLAKNRFNDALLIKPYFKEAQDGWDVVSRRAYVTQNNPIPRAKEYPIDRYYRLLKSDPENYELRLKLASELINKNRIEEAFNQYQILNFQYPEKDAYEKLLNDFYEYRDSIYHYRVDSLKNLLISDPQIRKNVMQVAEYYMLLEEYENSVKTVEKYMQITDEKDQHLMFLYSRVLAWNREIENSLMILDELIFTYPKEWKYKLFRAQLSIWEERELTIAEAYINEVLSTHPYNVEVLIAKATLLGINKDFESSQSYIDRVKTIDPVNFDIFTVQSKLEFQKLRAEEDERFKILEVGRKFVIKGDCDSAITYYENYLSMARPNNVIKKEYGDILFCAKRYDEALQIYNEVLSEGYMYEASLERGKLYYVTGDSIRSLSVFNQLVVKEPGEFEPRLYLGDTYMKMEEYDSALAVYDTLLTWDLDSAETALVNQRIGWIPPTGFSAALNNFPYLIGLAPAIQYYSDNLSFQHTKVGARLDVGIFQHLILGVSLYQTFTRASAENLNSFTLSLIDSSSLYGFTGRREFTTFKGHAFIPFTKELMLSGSYGTIRTSEYNNQHETEITLKFDNQKAFGISVNFLNSDAEMILFSPYIIDYHDSNGVRLRASLYRLQGYYTHNDKLLMSGFFDYLDISDGNEGNTFQLRFGSKFSNTFSAGYEYFFQNYKYRDVLIYYSPRNYDSHSLWAEYQLEKTDETKLFLGGKLGYAPSVNQLVLEAHFNASYSITSNFNLIGKISFGQSSQYNSAYRYLSLNVHAYWIL